MILFVKADVTLLTEVIVLTWEMKAEKLFNEGFELRLFTRTARNRPHEIVP